MDAELLCCVASLSESIVLVVGRHLELQNLSMSRLHTAETTQSRHRRRSGATSKLVTSYKVTAQLTKEPGDTTGWPPQDDDLVII
jgi:hypothetical protein